MKVSKRNKVLSVIFSILVFAGLLSGIASAEVTKIKLWQHLDRPDLPYYYNLIDEFNRTHPDIFVEFELVPWASAYEKYLMALIAGNPADVIFHSPTWGSYFWDMGALEPLDSYIAEWDKADEIYESAWESSKASYDEPIFGIPVYHMANYLYYRADWYEELGLGVPETMDDFLDAATKLTGDIDGDGRVDRYGFGMRGARGGNAMWVAFVTPAVDGQWVDEDGNCTFRREEAIEQNQWYVDLFRKHRVTPPTAPSDGFAEIIEGFKNGLTAMTAHHIMSAGGMIDALGDENVGVTIYPSLDGKRASDLGLHHYVIPKACKDKEAAFTFATWMSERNQVTYFAENYGVIPVIKNLDDTHPQLMGNRFFRTSVESIPFASNPPCLETLGEFTEQAWPASFQQALLGQITSEQMMNRIADVLEGKK